METQTVSISIEMTMVEVEEIYSTINYVEKYLKRTEQDHAALLKLKEELKRIIP